MSSSEYELTDNYFTFQFQSIDEELGPDQRWSTWLDVERGSRGPEPRPEWVVTEQAAIDTELGVLKTGKEADVFLLERAVEAIGDNPAKSSLLAA
ncbi:MAG TPA: serine/threonine protein kinase, partial [Kribbella sp.]|nr:serine/threonine protein kinase [Kribbella sp.]